jgi:N-methylhydantoinase A
MSDLQQTESRDLLIGIDIGGTFTDAAVLTGEGEVITAKVPSTPPNFEKGFFDALEQIAAELSLDMGSLLARTAHLGHGTTVATNILVERRGADVGLLATAGHGDAIMLMRGEGRTAGMPPEVIANVHASNKPEPIVTRSRIAELHERVDSSGNIVVALAEEPARATIRALVEGGADAYAISLMWSFKNNTHEQRVMELVEEIAPEDTFVSCSADLVPRMGEYERTAATVLNAYVGPATRDYIRRIDVGLTERGYDRPLLIMQCTGGVARADVIQQRPLFTFQSGPVGGAIGSAFLGSSLNRPNLITTDVGGTSFDVALVIDGEPLTTSRTTLSQYSFYLPMVDVRSIGAGGGSIAAVDPTTGRLTVGPVSAGALPGPVCYSRGGTQPTVTDAAAVLGYLHPTSFLGGRMRLDVEAARTALAVVAEQLGRSVEDTASGILQIVEFRMADLLRAMTIERGYDPRDFDVLVFGGAGPLHAATYARELGASQAIIPLGEVASVWSAFGVASSDIVELEERVAVMAEPLDASALVEEFEIIEQSIRERLRDSVDLASVTFQRSLDIRYKGQLHEVEVDVTGTDIDNDFASSALPARFQERYSQLYGEAAALPNTPIEIITFRSRARQRMSKAAFSANQGKAQEPVVGSRKVYWSELGEYADTPVLSEVAKGPLRIESRPGPCILDLPITTVVVRPGQSVRTDELGNIIIDLKGQ